MVASIFVIQGYDTFRRPERVAPRAEPVVRPLAERFPAGADRAAGEDHRSRDYSGNAGAPELRSTGASGGSGRAAGGGAGL